MAKNSVTSAKGKGKRVANEYGRRIGEGRPRAKLSRHEIDLLRELIEDLIASGMSMMQAYRAAAVRFTVTPRFAV